MIYYRHCLLRKQNTYQTSWIPEQFVFEGNYLKLRNQETKEWEDGWKIVGIGSRQAEDLVLENSQDYKKQREASDI